MQSDHVPALDDGGKENGKKAAVEGGKPRERSVAYDWIFLLVLMSAIYGIGYWISR